MLEGGYVVRSRRREGVRVDERELVRRARRGVGTA